MSMQYSQQRRDRQRDRKYSVRRQRKMDIRDRSSTMLKYGSNWMIKIMRTRHPSCFDVSLISLAAAMVGVSLFWVLPHLRNEQAGHSRLVILQRITVALLEAYGTQTFHMLPPACPFSSSSQVKLGLTMGTQTLSRFWFFLLNAPCLFSSTGEPLVGAAPD